VLLGQFGRHVLRERRGREVDAPVPPREGSSSATGYFAETGHNVGGRFWAFWNDHGGLAQFGLPLTEEFDERLEDGQTYRVQYFERARFEHHPEHAPPYDMLLGQFGRAVLASRPAGDMEHGGTPAGSANTYVTAQGARPRRIRGSNEAV
jgi:hypothetical protein